MNKTLVKTEESAGAVIRRKFFEKLRKFLRKTPVLESLFNEVSGIETGNFIKK